MPNISSFGTQTDNAVVQGTVTDRQMIIPEVPPQGLMSVGPRVTPNFVKPREWNAQTTYHFFDAVRDTAGNAYVATKPVVPAGTPLTDEDYWFLWADPDTRFDDLNETVKTFNQRITQNTSDIKTKAPINHASEETIYGVGNAVNFGHLKLSTHDTPMTSDANEGVAVTPEYMNGAISKNAESIAPAAVNIFAANGMLACARTYIDGATNNGLTYHDGTGANLPKNTISCVSLVRAVLDGIPYSDYRAGNDDGLSRSQLFNRYGYQLANSPFKFNSKPTSQDLYNYFKSLNLTKIVNNTLDGAAPGCIFFVGDTENSINHCGLYVCNISGSNITIEASSTNTIGVEFKTFNKLAPNFVAIAYPNIIGGYHRPESILLDNNIVDAVKNQMLFVDVTYKAEANSKVQIGATTFTTENAGIGSAQTFIKGSFEGKTNFTVSGVEQYKARVRRSLIDDSNVELFSGTQADLIANVKEGRSYDIYISSGSDGIEQGLYNVLIARNIASQTINITLINFRNNEKKIYECSLPNDSTFTKISFA